MPKKKRKYRSPAFNPYGSTQAYGPPAALAAPSFNQGTQTSLGAGYFTGLYGGSYGPAALAPPSPPSAPDFSSILEGDPLFRLIKSGLRGEHIADRAARDAALKRAIIQFGEVPNFAGWEGGAFGSELASILDPTTRALASQSTQAKLSTTSRLNEARDLAVKNIRDVLAGRGLYRSGETGYQFGRAQTEYERAQYDARQKLLDYLMGVQAAYIQAERARQKALFDAMLNVNPPSGEQPPSGGHPPFGIPPNLPSPPSPDPEATWPPTIPLPPLNTTWPSSIPLPPLSTRKRKTGGGGGGVKIQ